MKKIKLLIASVLFCALGYAGYTTYERATMSETEKYILANVEALTEPEPGGGSGDEYNCSLEKDKCVITVKGEADILKLKKLGFGSFGIGATVDLTDLTRLYKRGGGYRCGTDKTCYDVFH